MTEHLVIRDFDEGDRAACLAIFDSNVPAYFLPAERDELETFLDVLPGPYLVLERREGEIVGCGGYALGEDGRRADLCWGMIRADLQGQGLGRRLTVERLARASRNPNVEEIRLSTSQRTTGFYMRLGFELASVEREGLGPGLDRCEMRRRTGPCRTGS